MLKRMLACLFILAVLPLLTSSIHDQNNPIPFATIVLAGHVNSGGVYCDCDGTSSHSINQAAPAATDGAVDMATAPTGEAGSSGLDFGSSAVMLMLAQWLWARLRG